MPPSYLICKGLLICTVGFREKTNCAQANHRAVGIKLQETLCPILTANNWVHSMPLPQFYNGNILESNARTL
jgi:hypothetical protein